MKDKIELINKNTTMYKIKVSIELAICNVQIVLNYNVIRYKRLSNLNK